jgi:hypothetical protein
MRTAAIIVAIVHLVGIDASGPEHRWRNGTCVYDPTAD